MKTTLQGRHVLIIEDDILLGNVIETALRREGAQVQIATDGQLGLMLFDHNQPDVVLLDLWLPFIDGWGVLEGIRKVSEVPVIIITADMDEQTKSRAKKMGASDYVTKPFSPKGLMVRIKAAVADSAINYA